MEPPTLTTMTVLYDMNVRLDTDALVRDLPLTDTIIKIEKQDVLRRGQSSKDSIRRRKKQTTAPKRTTGFSHNSITLVALSDGIDHSLRQKEITVKIFQNGLFHITGTLDEKYDRDVMQRLRTHITETCPVAIVSGDWEIKTRTVALMNYKTRFTGIASLSCNELYAAVCRKGIKSSYDPDVHPGVTITFQDKHWSAKIFRTGNLLLFGSKSRDECIEFVTRLGDTILPFVRSTESHTLKDNGATIGTYTPTNRGGTTWN